MTIDKHTLKDAWSIAEANCIYYTEEDKDEKGERKIHENYQKYLDRNYFDTHYISDLNLAKILRTFTN